MEIVAKLISTKLLDVVFTTDGKEYITPVHLTKELKDEAYVQGGIQVINLNYSNDTLVVMIILLIQIK